MSKKVFISEERSVSSIASELKENSSCCLLELENVSQNRLEDDSDRFVEAVLSQLKGTDTAGLGITEVITDRDRRYYAFGNSDDEKAFYIAVYRAGGALITSPCFFTDGMFIQTATIDTAIECNRGRL